ASVVVGVAAVCHGNREDAAANVGVRERGRARGGGGRCAGGRRRRGRPVAEIEGHGAVWLEAPFGRRHRRRERHGLALVLRTLRRNDRGGRGVEIAVRRDGIAVRAAEAGRRARDRRVIAVGRERRRVDGGVEHHGDRLAGGQR